MSGDWTCPAGHRWHLAGDATLDGAPNCPQCGGLLETGYPEWKQDPEQLKAIWRARRTCNLPLDQSGVWRYREIIPFLENLDSVVSLREGNTPLLAAPQAAEYGGLDRLICKHQGFNPTGSFKDNGMTCGVAQARRLGMRRVVLDLVVDPADGAGMSWLYRHTEVMEKSLGDNGKMAMTVRVDPTRTETVKAKFPMH